jgi:hypothetical protein
MKRILIILVLCLVLVGCKPEGDFVNSIVMVEKKVDLLHISVAPENAVEMLVPYEYGFYHVVRFEDVEEGNTCYIFADYEHIGTVSGLSCVKGE